MKGKKDRFVEELQGALEYAESVRGDDTTAGTEMSEEKQPEPSTKPSEVQPTAVLAQVGVMPDGNLQVAVAQEVTDRVAFCMEVGRMFSQLASQEYIAEKANKGPKILTVPPGTRVQ